MLHNDLLKKYKVLRLLHHGVGGEVWLAEHTGLSGRRVIKVIERANPWYDTLIREAKVLQQCHHSSIPIIYDILEFDTQTYIVEEFIEGETLKQQLLRKKHLSGSQLLDYSIQLCEILQYLHHPARGILHLDLKPDNLLISNLELKLVDFGSAICKNQQKQQTVIFGTPGFAAPEQSKDGVLSEQTDIYSLGRCMEYMYSYAEKSPKGYRTIVEGCLRRGRKRYEAASEVRLALEKLKKKKRWEKQEEIWYAVTGVSQEQDSTLFATGLAVYLRKRYKRPVLYLDCNPKQPMIAVENPENGFVTERNGISIAGRIAPQEVKGWRQRGYRYIVCDFGNESPALSGQSFAACFLNGVVTQWTKAQWSDAMQCIDRETVLRVVLSGGDSSLARRLVSRRGSVCRCVLYDKAFALSGNSRRQIKRVLRFIKK